jgi:NAD+ synthase (glutamine-hydrolysing)
MMKVLLAQQNYHIGDFEYNLEKILLAIQHGRDAGADLVVFTELAVCGYPPRDFLYADDFISRCEKSIAEIASNCRDIAVLIGAPRRNPNPTGKKLFNSVYFIDNGKIQQVIDKTCLPTYDIFDEDRHFEPAHSWKTMVCKGRKIAVTICEDIWNMGAHPLYGICPMDQLMEQQPDIMINLSASPFDYTHHEDRLAILAANYRKYRLPIIYCNTVGSQTEIIFDGASLVMDGSGNLKGKLKSFEEDLQLFEMEGGDFTGRDTIIAYENIPQQESDPAELNTSLNIPEIHAALVLGIRDYFRKMGFKKAILGSSGGVDSAVTLALAVEALGAENVEAVLMPSPFSSAHSVDDAVSLSKKLDNPYQVVPIDKIFASMQETLHSRFGDLPFGLAEENMQSRIRGNILMSIANKFGFILLNTSNKSELATGYGTLYGDMAGGLSVLGDCYKQQVYTLARYINRDSEIIPMSILEKAPSAELRPNQKDSDSLPDYSLLDAVLYQYIEKIKGPAEIKSMGFDPALVDRVLKLVNANEYKRNQFCPIIRVSPKAFGVGRRMPIVARYLHSS